MKKLDLKLLEYDSPKMESIEMDVSGALCEVSPNPPGDDVHFGDDIF